MIGKRYNCLDTTENIQNGDYSNLDKLFDKYEEHEDWLEEVEDGEWLVKQKF